MATDGRSSSSGGTDLDLIVDTDAHLSERAEQLVPYLEEPYASLFGGGDEGANVATPSYPKDELFRSLGGKVQWSDVSTPEALRESMSEFGIDYVLITPTLNLYLPIFSDERFAHALSKAYNDFVVAEFLDEGDEGFKAAITLSPLAPHRAAEEIDRLADHPDMVAAIVGSTGIFPPLGDRRYDPIFEALSAHDLPLVLHGATGSFISAHPFIKRGLKSYWELHIVSHPFSQMIQMTSLVGQGVPERFPDLDIVMQEAGIGWIPFTMYRMDNEYGKRRSEVPILEQKPSEYVRDQFYFTSQPMAEPENTEHLEWMIRMFGGQDRLMFSTDYPHYDFDTPEELYRMIRHRFDDETVRKIFGETAREVFDLG
jgi:predicted TIM-barrel fold metal-dependent hydrolase